MNERSGQKKQIPPLSPFFRQNLESGALQRVTPLLVSADILLNGYRATREAALLDEAQHLLEKYTNLAGESLL